MTREEYMAAIRRRSEIRQEMETLQQTLARENRDMTDAERQQFAALRASLPSSALRTRRRSDSAD